MTPDPAAEPVRIGLRLKNPRRTPWALLAQVPLVLGVPVLPLWLGLDPDWQAPVAIGRSWFIGLVAAGYALVTLVVSFYLSRWASYPAIVEVGDEQLRVWPRTDPAAARALAYADLHGHHLHGQEPHARHPEDPSLHLARRDGTRLKPDADHLTPQFRAMAAEFARRLGRYRVRHRLPRRR